jgi:hypothetical protein
MIRRAQLSLQLPVTRLIYRHQRRITGAHFQCVRIGQPAARTEHLQKSFGLRIDSPERSGFLKDDSPRKNRED